MTWQLWRQDDNGIRFVVGSYPSQEAAEEKMAELTRYPHKQIYWITESMTANQEESRKHNQDEVRGTVSSHETFAVCDEKNTK